MYWHTQTLDEIYQTLQTTAAGLTEAAAAGRLTELGPNELQERGGKNPLRMLWEQFTATMVLILLAAAAISALLNKGTEAAAITAIVVLFAVLGFVQEYRAERALTALKQLAVPTVRVRRQGAVREISARDLVPGDIIILEAGNAVPADARLLESVNLRVQEAALTGEAEAVEKQTAPLSNETLPLGDRRNMVYLGTTVTYGRGVAVIVATGMATELGKIAALIQGVQPETTPLQRRLDQLGKLLAGAGIVAAMLVLLIGVLRGEPVADMFLTAVSVAVAIIPEGLPAVVTITLALGAQRMLKRRALVRKLPAVETLGAVTVICSDKTGTLTENRMTVTVVDMAGQRLELTEPLVHGQPMFVTPCQDNTCVQALELTLAIGALCNDATLHPGAHTGEFHALGDPTEGALLVAAARQGVFKEQLEQSFPRVAELPFDSDRKRMTTVHSLPPSADRPAFLQALLPGDYCAFTKGSVDGLVQLSTQVWVKDRAEPLTPAWRERILTANAALAQAGMRVLGLTCQLSSNLPAPTRLEQDLIFVGLVGLMDPPRAAVKPAVATCQAAGIRPVMITGDHPLTAEAIAQELGIATQGGTLTGTALAQFNAADLRAAVGTVSVYARVSPEDKLKIVEALQAQGEVVAMTGDGVNDSPALKKADIGVAMGITGTDVAKEAAAIVLLDDNFTTIVAAVEEGRTIYNNLLRFIKFSLGGNLGKVLVMLGAPLFGINVALRPLQLLWLNLLTDGLLGLGLGVEPAEPTTMHQPPRRPTAPLLDTAARRHVTWVGLLIAALTLAMGAIYQEGPIDWQTMLFATLGFSQVAHALGLRAGGRITANPLLTGLTGLVLALQLAVIYLPFLNGFFGLRPLPLPELALTAGLGSLVFVGAYLERRFTRRSR